MRIRTTPIESEIDGVHLEHLQPGTVHDVSASVGSWLVAQGYADLEMRGPSYSDLDELSDAGLAPLAPLAPGPRRRRRSSDS